MSNRMWDNTVEHAKTCVLSGVLYVYYSDDTRSTGAVFNHVYELRGIISSGQFLSLESISHDQKVNMSSVSSLVLNAWWRPTTFRYVLIAITPCEFMMRNQMYLLLMLELTILKQISVDLLVKRAYENWDNVVEYDGQALLSPTNARQKQPSLPLATFFNASADQCFMPSVHTDSSYSPEIQAHAQLNRPQSNLSAELSLGEWPRAQDERRFEDYYSEEEIRMRSSEILQHDDMQRMLRSLTSGVGIGGYGTPSDSCYSFAMTTPFEPQGECGRGQERSRGSSKAVVSWLKLKAAFRWGIFVRKRAAERRAQLLELD